MATALAGCSFGDDADPATVEMSVTADDGETETALWENERETLEPGEYFFWEISLNWEHEITYDVEVTDGDSVDIHIMEDAELEKLRDEEPFEVIEDASWMDVTAASGAVTLPEGDYWIVILNADLEPENV